jgi:polyisoprenoid-binding protein YceI
MSEQNLGAATAEQDDVGGLLAAGRVAGRWVIDPSATSVEFHVKHFWGAITVHGSLGTVTGEGTVAEDGSVTGELTIDATALTSGNKQRDKHLRAADFFDVANHPRVVLTVTAAKPAGPAELACRGTLEAAGHTEPVEFTAHVSEMSADAIVLRSELDVDRTKFAMTWSPLRIAAPIARGTVVARFVNRPRA